ncbi:MAG: hypothetical protein ACM34K_13245 [Bacillota bacterium]
MKEKLLAALKWIIAVPIAIYLIFAERHYYIVSTGYCEVLKRRMWSRIVFTTKGKVIPIRSIENKIKEECAWESCIVVSITKISKTMALYADKEMDVEISEKE